MKRKLPAVVSFLALCFSATARAQDRSTLPVEPAPFRGVIAESVLDSTPTPAIIAPVKAPTNAPNVLMFMSDDVGFAMSSVFGGPVPTPNFARLAAMGETYNRFHTTAICSASRAALLTGRNHHNTGVGLLSDYTTGFPGYTGEISRETATIAQILRLNGYNTAMFGKHHNISPQAKSAAGPFDAWPTGLGFEYFFGTPFGGSNQFQPITYRGTSQVDPREGDGKMLDQWLADDLIGWVHNQKAAAPNKPFLIYYAPLSTHAPHGAPAEYIARFKGKFDQGWDEMRMETFHRQLVAGIVPRGTKLTPRPTEIPAWNSLSPEEKAFAARSMEVAAGMLAYQDEQFGRVLSELERMGELQKTLVVTVMGDNGASGEGGVKGSFDNSREMGGSTGDDEWRLKNFERLGGPLSNENYPVGWAWAMDTPFRWTKQYASMLGGIRNGLIVAWPGHIARPGSICSEFGHLVDIAPTILDAVHVDAPTSVFGVRQKPMDGQSLLPSLSACQPLKNRTQYFEITGKIGLYHDGWFLSGENGRMPWDSLPPGGVRPNIEWTLYDLSKDFSQATDLANKNPVRLQSMLALWREQAQSNNVFPLDNRFGAARVDRDHAIPTEKHYDYWGKDISVSAFAAPNFSARTFSIDADVQLASGVASGVVVARGSRFGGWSLYLNRGHLSFAWASSTNPKDMVQVTGQPSLSAGRTKIHMRLQTIPKPGSPAEIVLSANGQEIARAQIPSNIVPLEPTETFDIGRDIGVPVTDYVTLHGMLEGDIFRVSIDFE